MPSVRLVSAPVLILAAANAAATATAANNGVQECEDCSVMCFGRGGESCLRISAGHCPFTADGKNMTFFADDPNVPCSFRGAGTGLVLDNLAVGTSSADIAFTGDFTVWNLNITGSSIRFAVEGLVHLAEIGGSDNDVRIAGYPGTILVPGDGNRVDLHGEPTIETLEIAGEGNAVNVTGSVGIVRILGPGNQVAMLEPASFYN